MRQSSRVDMDKHRALLVERLMSLLPDSGDCQPFEGVGFYRRHNNHGQRAMLYRPAVVIIAQGKKHIRIGQEEYINGGNTYFIAGVDMPTTCAMGECSSAQPFLSITIDLDRALIARMLAEIPPAPALDKGETHGAKVVDMEPEFLDAVLRLTELALQPEAEFLVRTIIRELHYRLLTGPFGHQLRTLNTLGLPNNQVAKAISWLKDNFHQPLQVEELARKVNMSSSTFHKHFKDVTSLSPLQYQKRLRLEEAQRLMLAEDLDATEAGFSVGYDSLSQFTREYKRLFGEPPRRDVAKMRNLTEPDPRRPRWGEALA